MLADGDTPGHAHDNPTARSNASTLGADQHGGTPGTANGTHKTASSTNGSSTGGNAHRLTGPGQAPTYFGHDREEVTRLLIQTLSDMGYHSAAESVSQNSGFDLESPTVAAFRSAVLRGSWPEAEKLLTAAAAAESREEGRNELVLAAGSDRNLMKFRLRQQKFLELLEQRDTSRALTVLRRELTPLDQDTDKLHFLSSLLMCRSTEDLMAKADWDGAEGQSRKQLLSELSRMFLSLRPTRLKAADWATDCISPSVMLPENRLAVLLEQVKQKQVDACLYHTATSPPSLYSDHACDRRDFPSLVAIELRELAGEAWQVRFSNDGSKLAACGSKELVMIWETKSFRPLHILRDSDKGVANLMWSPDDSRLLTCGHRGDNYVRVWNVQSGVLVRKLGRFGEPVSSCVWSSDGASVILGTLDKNQCLCTFDLYNPGQESFIWGKKYRVQDLCVSPDGRWIVAAEDSHNIYVYSAVTHQAEYHMDLGARPTSLSISQDSRHVLVNQDDGVAQLIDLVTRDSVRKFLGHKGGEFLIRSALGGANESFAVSGSDDGQILIWHKLTGTVVERLSGHRPRCNAVCWNPKDPGMLASCGDDGLVNMYVTRRLDDATMTLTGVQLDEQEEGSRTSGSPRPTT